MASSAMQSSNLHEASPPTAGFRLSFTQGFLAGQLSVVLIALVAIRYIIFEDSRSASHRPRSGRGKAGLPGELIRKGHKSSSKRESRNAGEANIATVMAEIMGKVRYEIDSHGGESVDWLNVLIGQALAGYREDILAGGWSAEKKSNEVQKTAREWMEDILNAKTIGRGMSFLDPIQVSYVSFGDAYPIFTNAKVRPADDTGRTRVEVDVDYSDCITLAIDTKLVVNLPRPRFAVLPISLGLTVERFSGTLAMELFSSEESAFLPKSHLQAPPRSRHELHLSLHPDFALDATATSLVGSRAKLQDVPKIEQLLVGRLRSYVHDRFVWPKYWSLTLPNLVPKNEPMDADVLGKATMQVAGQGDELEEEEGEEEEEYGPSLRRQTDPDDTPLDKPQDGFFETAPPLFPHAGQSYPSTRHPEPPPSLPGSLPTVEAWRSQAAATGVNHRSQSRPPPGSRVGLSAAYPNEARLRNGTSVGAPSSAY